MESLLDAILTDVLTNESAKTLTDFYGTPGEKDIVLVNTTGSVPWPQSYAPTNIAGWHVIPDKQYTRPTIHQSHTVNRKLGIRIDCLRVIPAALESQSGHLLSGPITVTMFNCGGSKNGGVIGGAFFYYSAKVKDGKWIVESRGSLGV